MTKKQQVAFDLVKVSDYYKQLAAGIPRAKKRIVIHAMTVIWGPATEVFVPMLESALKRGVSVHIVGDYYSKFAANREQIGRHRSDPKWSHTRAVNYRLEDQGAVISYIGTVGLNPFRRRCHSKITIIDDTVFTFGGINFTSGSFDNHDYMLSATDKSLADRLANLVETIRTAKGTLPDLLETIDTQTTLLFDGGTPNTSVIYDTACDMVANAAKVYYVSQMCPSGRLAKALVKTDSICYFVRASQAQTPANVALIVDSVRYHMKNHYTGKGYIHAKFILCENTDGSTALLSGSNNFSWRGINYGTKEIAIRSTDPKLWQQFYDFMQNIIA